MGVIGFLILLMGGALVGMGALSHQPPELGLSQGRLLPCPQRPNCLCSEPHPLVDPRNYTAPIYLQGTPADQAWERLLDAVRSTGGTLVETRDDYLRATYTSSLFRFVDDLEARLDAEAGVAHLRSASRVGYSDLGVNRIRVDRLRARFQSSRHR